MPSKTKEMSDSELAEAGQRKTMDLSKLEETGILIDRGPVVSSTDGRTHLGEMIRHLRKEKGISQKELARKAQIDRTTVARVECGIIKSLSMERLEGIAAAVGTDLKTILHKTGSAVELTDYRGQLNQIAFSLDYPEDGFRITSLTPKQKEFFFGKIEIQAQKTIPSVKLPHPAQIYLHLFDAKILLARLAKEALLKAGDCFIFSGVSDYELYNPDPLKTASALFVTYPSFLPI